MTGSDEDANPPSDPRFEQTASLEPGVLRDALAPSAPPRTFRGLVLHSLLGAGGMGEAWLASHPVLRSPLVIKRFDAQPGTDPFREAWLAARVRDQHTVEVVDAGYEDGRPFVVQRYVDGVDLWELLERVGVADLALPTGVVAALLADAARGLHAIHQAGVVHRDVKPANLFLDGMGRCSTGDFGVAIDAHQEADASPSGTPLFTAPELWRGAQVDRRADVYALGASAHLLATGSPPFSAASVGQLSWLHLNQAYDRPAGARPEDAFFFAVADRCLAKEPDGRYASAGQVAAALGRVATARPSLEHRPGGASVGRLSIELRLGDLTEVASDLIVNAANPELAMREGVAAALKAVGGDDVEAAVRPRAPAAMGDVVIGPAGALPAKHLAHAVGVQEGAVCIQRAVLRVLLEAEALGAESVAFPSLGTGIGQVSMAQAATLMLEAARTFAWLEPQRVRTLRFVLLEPAGLQVWSEVLAAM